MRTLTVFLCVIYLSGCTVAGAIIDGQAQSNARDNKYSNSPARSEPYKNPLEPVPKDKNGFSFTDIGLKIDSLLINLVKGEGNTVQVCREVNKVLKECVEVDRSELHTNETTQIKTDYEMISVGQ
ncbi:hypothetical protein [Pseudoalteromonas sp. C12FD-1]|jgi:hypothetical protein|uniref:hypothetical protein n=1 Tax=Pseudoalteromonas sp. C12FD-1 TaxID=3131979 RepID=UPI00307D071A